MRSLLRSVATLSALSLSVVAAHATTYTATPSLIDLTHPGNVTAVFNSSPITFNDPPTTSFTDDFTIIAPYGDYSDELDLDVAFTAPGTGGGTITGDADISAFFFFTGGQVTWDFASTSVTLSNGSVATISVPTDRRGNPIDVDMQEGYGCPLFESCGTSAVTINVTTNDPAATPEPSSLALLGTGVLGVAGVLRRKLAV